jgi:protocatechuate 3,4-dioxygenase beta subunit
MSGNKSISRRRFVAASLAIATTAKLQRAAESLGVTPQATVCRLSPEQEVGPYYVADELLRGDITEGKRGVPLVLRMVTMDARTCQPLPQVAVDLWHCDALGLYSGFTKQNPRGPGGPPPDFDPQHPGHHPGPPERMGPPPENHPTDHLTFLRGIQMTDSKGVVEFRTVFPGVYPGRTNHIHFKVRVGGQAGRSYRAGHTSHVGQVFFPEELAIQLMQQEPYRQHQIHRTTQAEDGVFGDQHGELSIAQVEALHEGDFTAGLRAELIASVDPAATPAAAERRGGPPRPSSGAPFPG